MREEVKMLLRELFVTLGYTLLAVLGTLQIIIDYWAFFEIIKHMGGN